MSTEQQSATPTKSADEVKASGARSQAEQSSSSRSTSGSSSSSGSSGGRSESKGSKHSASVEMTWHTPAVSGGNVDTSDVHPATGKSLEYSSGQGREAYAEGHYATDAVNRLDHLSHAMVPRNQFD